MFSFILNRGSRAALFEVTRYSESEARMGQISGNRWEKDLYISFILQQPFCVLITFNCLSPKSEFHLDASPVFPSLHLCSNVIFSSSLYSTALQSEQYVFISSHFHGVRRGVSAGRVSPSCTIFIMPITNITGHVNQHSCPMFWNRLVTRSPSIYCFVPFLSQCGALNGSKVFVIDRYHSDFPLVQLWLNIYYCLIFYLNVFSPPQGDLYDASRILIQASLFQ